MTDRELVKAAALAAGIEGNYYDDPPGIEYWTGEPGTFQQHVWNPLTDDGDALRLAVKLGIQLEQDWFDNGNFARGDGRARAFTTYSLELVGSYDARPAWFKEDFNGDPYAATRRAIVRAAAAMVQP